MSYLTLVYKVNHFANNNYLWKYKFICNDDAKQKINNFNLTQTVKARKYINY